MCGIAGIVGVQPLDALMPDAAERAVAMRDVMTHRGPDESGLHAHPHAVLAHRRLSIVDLASGQQPLSNEDGSVWVTYNGEIYNHAEIRAELEAHGHVYRTRSDTETIVHAYEEWGDACVQRFRGMFAFAIWDEPRQRLLLVRDRLGVKPLYWARRGDTLLFASEIKGILASGLVEPRANEPAIPELLSTRYISGTETLFQDIHKLQPAHLLTLQDGQLRIRQYWDVPLGERDTAIHPQQVVPKFRALLQESVRLRLMSDVPLGMFLSGGIDSSAIATLMAQLIGRPLETFSVAFEEQAFNELGYARQVSNAIGAVAHEVVIDDRDFFSALPRLIWHEDEPIAHPSSVPLYFVSALARQHVTVVLTGEGSDELLAGYGKYPRITWNWRAGTVYQRMLPRGMRHAIGRTVVSRVPGRLGRYARRSFLSMDRTPASMFLDNFSSVRLADQRRLLTPRLQRWVDADRAFGPSLDHFAHASHGTTLLDRLLYTDIKTYLVELLMKQDQMSMAASIESRVPFLDHKLVEFAARLPDEWKLSGLTTKRVLRDAMKGLLPPTILHRPKMGFPVPMSRWSRGDWKKPLLGVLLDRRTRERGIVDGAAIERLFNEHAAGHIDAGDRIWSLVNLELWYRTFIDGAGAQVLPEPQPRASHLTPIGASAGAAGVAVGSAEVLTQ